MAKFTNDRSDSGYCHLHTDHGSLLTTAPVAGDRMEVAITEPGATGVMASATLSRPELRSLRDHLSALIDEQDDASARAAHALEMQQGGAA